MVFVVSANRPAPVEGEFRSSRQQVAMVRSPIRPSRETGVISRRAQFGPSRGVRAALARWSAQWDRSLIIRGSGTTFL